MLLFRQSKHFPIPIYTFSVSVLGISKSFLFPMVSLRPWTVVKTLLDIQKAERWLYRAVVKGTVANSESLHRFGS